MKALQLGGVEVIRIEEMILAWDLPYLFPELGEADLAPHMDWLAPRFFTPEGKMRLSVHAFVVKTPHHTILVDTCVGNDKERPNPDFNMLQTDFLGRLKSQAGVTPEQVDYVFCTHFHVDHVGWNTRLVDGRWEPTFPNARYLFHRPEFEYYTGLPKEEQQPSLLDSVLPIAEAGKAELVDGGHRIGDHVTLEPTPGHTPGHCSVRIDTPQGRAVITGDMMHTPAQVVETAWTPRVDHDPQMAIATRKDFIERHAEAGSLVLGTHFAPPTACRFEAHGAGHRPRFV
ncbi:MAG: MBL fold metallo-hydrolase [SAR324 cluster bacterium]|nr:MBL fold metallo-hydrolase [SAR324 cluster bacterium]MCZ6557363.1 MBL fold metallo-hydrolase [SAR324 cluster bacterium]